MSPGYGGVAEGCLTLAADLQLEARGLGLDILCPQALQGQLMCPSSRPVGLGVKEAACNSSGHTWIQMLPHFDLLLGHSLGCHLPSTLKEH